MYKSILRIFDGKFQDIKAGELIVASSAKLRLISQSGWSFVKGALLKQHLTNGVLPADIAQALPPGISDLDPRIGLGLSLMRNGDEREQNEIAMHSVRSGNQLRMRGGTNSDEGSWTANSNINKYAWQSLPQKYTYNTSPLNAIIGETFYANAGATNFNPNTAISLQRANCLELIGRTRDANLRQDATGLSARSITSSAISFVAASNLRPRIYNAGEFPLGDFATSLADGYDAAGAIIFSTALPNSEPFYAGCQARMSLDAYGNLSLADSLVGECTFITNLPDIMLRPKFDIKGNARATLGKTLPFVPNNQKYARSLIRARTSADYNYNTTPASVPVFNLTEDGHMFAGSGLENREYEFAKLYDTVFASKNFTASVFADTTKQLSSRPYTLLISSASGKKLEQKATGQIAINSGVDENILLKAYSSTSPADFASEGTQALLSIQSPLGEQMRVGHWGRLTLGGNGNGWLSSYKSESNAELMLNLASPTGNALQIREDGQAIFGVGASSFAMLNAKLTDATLTHSIDIINQNGLTIFNQKANGETSLGNYAPTNAVLALGRKAGDSIMLINAYDSESGRTPLQLSSYGLGVGTNAPTNFGEAGFFVLSSPEIDTATNVPLADFFNASGRKFWFGNDGKIGINCIPNYASFEMYMPLQASSPAEAEIWQSAEFGRIRTMSPQGKLSLGAGSGRAMLDIYSLGSTDATLALQISNSSFADLLKLDNAGKLGLNTTPSATLEVKNVAGVPLAFKVTDSAGTTLFSIAENGTITPSGGSAILSNVVKGIDAIGADTPAQALEIQTGLSNGSAVPADILFNTTNAIGSGSTGQALATKVRIKGETGAMLLNKSIDDLANLLQVNGGASFGAISGAHAQPGSTNSSGSPLLITAGVGTGTGGLPFISFRLPTLAASGTTKQATTEYGRFSPAGNFLLGTAADGGQRLQVAGSALITGATNFNSTVAMASTLSVASSIIAAGFVGRVSSGTNIASNNLTIAGNVSTGSGIASDIVFSTSTSSTSGTATQALSPRMAIKGTSGAVVVGNVAYDGSSLLQVNGKLSALAFFLPMTTAPATATSAGVIGEIRTDGNFVYVCTATNTWKRSALTTW